jgi:hypothetical protein
MALPLKFMQCPINERTFLPFYLIIEQRNMNETIQEILDVFSKDELDGYPREILDLALLHYEELEPHLVVILEDVLKEAELHPDCKWSYGPMFSMQLLAHYNNTDAHETIVKIMSLREEIIDSIFGDMITEGFPRILFQTCGNKYEKIKELALNQNAYEYVRGSAICALVLGVFFGTLPRSEALEFFSSILTSRESDENSNLLDETASSICDLYPEELMETIRNAYDKGVIWPGYIGIEEFEEALTKEKEEYLEGIKGGLATKFSSNFHDYLSGWAAFRNDEESFEDDSWMTRNGYKGSNSKSKDPKKKKTKNKKAKASRKKNKRR